MQPITHDEFQSLMTANALHNPMNIVVGAASTTYFYDDAQSRVLALPDHETFYTAMIRRNQPFVTPDEQMTLREATVGIAGQGTVGGNVALSLVRYGFERLRTCDPDAFDVTNLNRQPNDLYAQDVPKAEHVARQAQRINPFAQIEVHPALTEANIAAFVAGCDVVISALDNAQLIVRLNQAARDQQVPVLLGTDLHSTVLLDVFDYRKTSQLLNGRIDEDDLSLPYLPLVAKIIGVENMPVEMVEAILMRINGEIDYFPQTVIAANMVSALLVEATQALILHKPLKELAAVDLTATLTPPDNLHERETRRQQAAAHLNAIIDEHLASV